MPTPAQIKQEVDLLDYPKTVGILARLSKTDYNAYITYLQSLEE